MQMEGNLCLTNRKGERAMLTNLAMLVLLSMTLLRLTPQRDHAESYARL